MGIVHLRQEINHIHDLIKDKIWCEGRRILKESNNTDNSSIYIRIASVFIAIAGFPASYGGLLDGLIVSTVGMCLLILSESNNFANDFNAEQAKRPLKMAEARLQDLQKSLVDKEQQ
jgi:hypothetical protein